MEMSEIKTLLDQQGEAFAAFKATHEELKKADVVTAEKLAKIESALDKAVEAKAALEVRIASEIKAREDFEKRMNRPGSGNAADDKRELEIKSMNDVLAMNAAEQKQAFEPLDAKGYDEYKGAFNRALRRPGNMLTPDEVKTLSVGSDPDGGYFVTPDISGRIVKKLYETSPMRQICSVQSIGTDALEGIEDLGEAGAGYAGEHTQGSDSTTPQVGKWRIPVFWIDTEPKTTQQLLDDASVDVEAWLADKVTDKFGRFENGEYVNGNAGKIRGITSYTTAADSGAGVSWGSFGHIATGVSGDFAASAQADALIDIVGLLKVGYLPNARWLTRRSVITRMRKFKDGDGEYIWQPGLNLQTPETLLGYPITRAEDMPAIGANSLSVAFGDFMAAYQIVDRQGIRVLRDNLTSKPYVKFYTTKRTGGGALNFEAVKFLKFG